VAVSAQRRRRVLVAVVAALIAAGAFYLAIEYTNKTPATSSGTAATATAPPGTTATVVVASANIPAGTLLTASNLKTEAVSTQVLTVLTTAGGADYPTIAALTASKEYAASAVSGIPAALPAGYVAISLPYSPASSSGTGEGTGGYIQALDRIDILVNEAAGGPVYWAYENVLVLAVGQATTGPVVSASASPAASASASSAPTVTGALIMVELPRQDAAALANVEDTSGAVIQYAIVSSGDYPSPSASPQPAITAPATTVTSPIQFFAG
jgi:Flp pilus assembly protein CpaB